MNAFRTAIKIYYFGKVNEEFEFNDLWFGKWVRRKMNDLRYLEPNIKRKFKSVSTPTKIIIWRVK